MKCLYNTLLFCVLCTTVFAQSSKLQIDDHIRLPKDSLESEAILSAIDAFLYCAQNDSASHWISPSENEKAQLLLDEIIDIQKHKKRKDDSFYKPYLTELVSLADDKYSVKIAYMGLKENTPTLRAIFEIIAYKENGRYWMTSPLSLKTQHWKTKQYGNYTFKYPYELDEQAAEEFVNDQMFYDEKLKLTKTPTHVYLSNDEVSPSELIGVTYKSDYNGRSYTFSTSSENAAMHVSTESVISDYSKHDLWHDKLSLVISRDEVHSIVDCNIATAYGGMWGKTWEELFPLFTEKFVVGENIDWLEHRKNKSHIVVNERRKVYTNDFIGALIIRKIEEEKGFDAVWDLLMTEKIKGDDHYYKKVDRLIGISKRNFNKEAQKLIEEEIRRLGS